MSNECSYCGKELTTDSYNQTCSDCRRRINNDLHNEVLLEAPTEEEVCKSLSQYFSYDDNIDSIKYHKYLAKSQRKGGQILIGWKSGGFSNVLNYLATATEDAPHLITMVGRFYETVKKGD